MNLKKIVIVFFTFFLNLNNLNAIEPDIFVQSTVNRASQILSDNISKDEKIDELKKIAKETVDIRGVGFYSLGPIRKNLTNDQKKSIWNYLRVIF
jgi:phospholipid transport system substrate-binding protein